MLIELLIAGVTGRYRADGADTLQRRLHIDDAMQEHRGWIRGADGAVDGKGDVRFERLAWRVSMQGCSQSC